MNNDFLSIKYNNDGSLKPFYSLASEKEIKEMQLRSDENELDYKFKQKEISKEEYEEEKELLEIKLKDQNYLYDLLIFDLIKEADMNDLKDAVKNANLSDIELKRLATSLTSIAENKIDDFQKNNKEFQKENISDWNFRYNIIANSYAKTRELENFILSLIE